MGQRHQLIKIAQSVGILGQQDDMVGTLLLEIVPHQISFHAINDFDVQLVFLDSFSSIRKGLDHTMVCYRNGGPPPAGGSLHQILHGHHCVHAAHGRMGMKLHPLHFRMVLAPHLILFGQAVHEKSILVHVGVKPDGTPNPHFHALFQGGTDFLEIFLLAPFTLLGLEEFLATDAISLICQSKGQHLGARLKLDSLDRQHSALKDDVFGLPLKLGNMYGLAHDTTAKDQLARPLQNHRLDAANGSRSLAFLPGLLG